MTTLGSASLYSVSSTELSGTTVIPTLSGDSSTNASEVEKKSNKRFMPKRGANINNSSKVTLPKQNGYKTFVSCCKTSNPYVANSFPGLGTDKNSQKTQENEAEINYDQDSILFNNEAYVLGIASRYKKHVQLVRSINNGLSLASTIKNKAPYNEAPIKIRPLAKKVVSESRRFYNDSSQRLLKNESILIQPILSSNFVGESPVFLKPKTLGVEKGYGELDNNSHSTPNNNHGFYQNPNIQFGYRLQETQLRPHQDKVDLEIIRHLDKAVTHTRTYGTKRMVRVEVHHSPPGVKEEGLWKRVPENIIQNYM